ncbi:MAG: BamA/TamA family outer membrane protein [Bacteroidales bacterium]|nr:BamA/TamA family outer membrane protein [Bacteroidales bacterium]
MLVRHAYTGILKTMAFVVVVLLCCRCSVTKSLEDGQKLLVKHKIAVDCKGVDKSEPLNYIKPQPNRNFLWLHLRLRSYFAFKDSERKFGTWMRDIVGEPPALYDEAVIEKNVQQIRLYMNEIGYYNASVSSSTQFKGKNQKKAKVYYTVNCGDLFKISSVSYRIPDSTISYAINRTINSSKVKEGKPFAIALLQEEQDRIVKLCNNFGYYAFTKDNVIFAADTTHGSDSVSVVISIKQTTPSSLKKHKIFTTKIDQNYSYQKKQPRRPHERDSVLESTNQDSKSTYVKPENIQRANYIEEGRLYSSFRVERTQKNLSSYSLFKLVNIEFTPSEYQDSKDTVNLDCSINITPEKRQSINVDVEGTNTSGDWGAALNTSYTNRNLFHGAEYFNLKLKLAGEYNKVLKEDGEYMRLFNSLEYGVAVNLTTPKFLVPFKWDNKRSRAKTNCHLEYNFLQTPDYTRPTSQASLGYIWYGKRFWTYTLSPIDISYIRYYDISERFSNFINSKNYYKYSYEDYLLYGNNFSVTYFNKRNYELRDYQYVRFYTELCGNAMYLLCKATGKEKNGSGMYETFSCPFAQYIKTEADYRYYDVVTPNAMFVYRIFGGIAIPYGNSSGLPSVKKYYGGGANSMRAWESRLLGLGSHHDTTNTFQYYLGDVKLEMNFESRFHLFWVLNGAVFVDVGNVWSFWNDELEGAEFHLKDFYKDLAVGTGFGLRFDFSFLVVRCDVGVKVREPYTSNNTNSHLIWGNRSLNRDDFNLNIGIGYPF